MRVATESTPSAIKTAGKLSKKFIGVYSRQTTEKRQDFIDKTLAAHPNL